MPPHVFRALLRVHAAAALGLGILLVVAIGATTADVRDDGVRPAALVTVALPHTHVRVDVDIADRDRVPVVVHRVAVKHRPATRVVRHKKARVVRWLPHGVGMWIYDWKRTGGGQAPAVVRAARSYGVTTLFARTGSTHDGFTGLPVLRTLLGATRGTNVKVVAWDFPELHNPVADAHRLAHALRIKVGGMRVAAVAPDIETPAEGTNSRAQSVRVYLQTLRASLPANVAILATVPWPSVYRVGHYPYGVVAGHSDALLPMAYWYDNSPVTVTAASMRYLKRYHRPIQPVGQGYDSTLDAPSLPHNNLAVQVPQFLRTAHAYGATAVSLWSWQSAPLVTWRALAQGRALFR